MQRAHQAGALALGIGGLLCVPGAWAMHHHGAPVGLCLAVFAAAGPLLALGRWIASEAE